MKLLALDLSTKSTGWSIYNGDKLIKYGIISAGSANLYHRIDKMIAELRVILDENNIEKAIIEDVIPDDVRGNHNVFKALIYLQAFVMHLMDEYKIEPELVVASHWRKNCGIKTGAGVQRTSLKPKDIAFVKKYFNLQVGDDEADAICIGYQATHKPIPVQDDEVIKDEFGFEFG